MEINRRIISITFYLLISNFAFSQSVGIGHSSPNSNAILDVRSPGNNQGVLFPRLSTAQRTSMTLATTDESMVVYDTDLNLYMFWDGTVWAPIGDDDGDWIVSGSDLTVPLTKRVGIGITAPNANLHVSGSFQLQNGSQSNGYVLQSDANGIATWVNPSTLPGDNLGNHAASQNISLAGFHLSNDGDAEGISITNNGNVTIGTGTSIVTIDGFVTVDENVSAKEYRFNTIQSRILSIPAASWRPTKPATVLSGNIDRVAFASGPDFFGAIAPLTLPNNVQLINVEFYVTNNSPSAATCRVYDANNEGGGFTSASTSVPSGGSGWFAPTGAFSSLPWTINNEGRNYFLNFAPSGPVNPDLILHACRITYTVTKAE